MISSSIAFATNVGQYVAVKDTLVRTSNGVMRVKVDYYQYDNPENGEGNFYYVEIGDTISLPPTEEYYTPFSSELGMRMLMDRFHQVGIPIVEQVFPQICKSVTSNRLWNVYMSVCIDDQKRILKKDVEAKSRDLDSINTFIAEMTKENCLSDCLEKIKNQFFEKNPMTAYSREKFPDYLKKQIEENKKGYYEMLAIDITSDYLQKY